MLTFITKPTHWPPITSLSIMPSAVLLTVSHGGQAQVLHAILDQLGQLLTLGASVQVESLLRDALCSTWRFDVLPAESPCPLHALLPQQRVFRLVARGRVPVGRLLLPGLSTLPMLLTLLHVDGHLRLGERVGTVNMDTVCVFKEILACVTLKTNF